MVARFLCVLKRSYQHLNAVVYIWLRDLYPEWDGVRVSLGCTLMMVLIFALMSLALSLVAFKKRRMAFYLFIPTLLLAAYWALHHMTDKLHLTF